MSPGYGTNHSDCHGYREHRTDPGPGPSCLTADSELTATVTTLRVQEDPETPLSQGGRCRGLGELPGQCQQHGGLGPCLTNNSYPPSDSTCPFGSSGETEACRAPGQSLSVKHTVAAADSHRPVLFQCSPGLITYKRRPWEFVLKNDRFLHPQPTAACPQLRSLSER